MNEPRRGQNVVGAALLLLLLVSWPASCEWSGRSARREAEAVARRAIERKYGATAQEAEELIQKQREWEGR